MRGPVSAPECMRPADCMGGRCSLNELSRLWDMLHFCLTMPCAKPVVRHALLSCTLFAWRCRVQQYAGLLLESLRGAALGLLQGGFAGDQAPWLEGPNRASIAGSLCALTVRLGLHASSLW